MSQTCEWPKLGAACLNLLEIDEAQADAIFAEAAPLLAAEDEGRPGRRRFVG